MRIDNTALEHAATRVGDRWSLRLIAALLDGDRTFGELADEVDGIAPNILSSRLRTLQAEALILARPYQRNPVRMRYSLTVPGRRLADAVALLAHWGATQHGDPSAPRHDTCGTTVELRPWCPTCEQPVETTTGDDLIWV